MVRCETGDDIGDKSEVNTSNCMQLSGIQEEVTYSSRHDNSSTSFNWCSYDVAFYKETAV